MVTLTETMPRFQDYLQHERKMVNATCKAYASDLRRLIQSVGDKHVAEITLDELRLHLRTMSKEGLARNTLLRRMHGLNTYFEWLVLEGLVTEKISAKIRLPKREFKQPLIATDSEMATFINTPSKHKLSWMLLAWFGLRRSEVLHLDWQDINFEGLTITVRDTKSKKDRVLPIAKNMLAPLQEQWERAGKPAAGRLTVSDKAYFQIVYKRHLKACGLNPAYTFHTWRHSFATRLHKRGVHVTVIQQLLGHERIETTMRYLHDLGGMILDAMELSA